MKWFVLVMMMGMYSDGTQDIYVYNDMGLKSLEECQTWVSVSGRALRQDMMNKFDGKQIERVFCIEEKKLREFFETIQSEEEGKSI
jgi:hypothetical protein